MERIEINGEWYVKESTLSTQQHEEEIILDSTHSECLIYESDKYCFEATRIYRDDDVSFYPDISIRFTDKRGGKLNWKEEYWDNEDWMLKVFINHPSTIEEILESVCKEGLKQFQFVLKDLIEKGWLSVEEEPNY